MLASWSDYVSPSTSTQSSSTRFSHLSALSSSSSISSTARTSPPPPPSPSGSRTHAFFSSFDSSPTPLPPPNPYKRSPSIQSCASVSSLSSQASSSASGCTLSDVHTSSGSGADETPRIEQRVPKRSLNDEFFGPSMLPTPPPTATRLPLSPSDSRESSSSPPAGRATLPPLPLSRLFPSRKRYGSEDPAGSGPLPFPSGEPSPRRRAFMELDTSVPIHGQQHNAVLNASSYADTYTTSPVQSEATTPAQHEHRLSNPVDPSDMLTPHPHSTDTARSSYISTAAESKPLPPIPLPVCESLPEAIEPGAVLKSASLTLKLERMLGNGAFSSVWLARDVQGQLGALELSRKTSLMRSRSEKRGRTRSLQGLRPNGQVAQSLRSAPLQPENVYTREDSDESVYLIEAGAIPVRTHAAGEVGRLVAVKMTNRALCDKNSRSRVSFVREVEILRHISHPSIVSYVHSFSTPSHHCLVLEYVDGGELFDLIDNPESHARLDETLLRRMFGELCKAVGWMHGVGLVHRDIKLENILLTTSRFASPLPAPPTPLIKLSDFGLSRFIDPAQPLLTTLCGSESYAAPELVTGRPYDGRETDAWACGVVLYALATRRLPFDLPQVPEREGAEAVRTRRNVKAERKALLVRIAKGEFAWPDEEPLSDDAAGPVTGLALARSAGLRRVVERLLVRDPRKRSRIIDLWEEGWMRGEGAPGAPGVLGAAQAGDSADGGAESRRGSRCRGPRAYGEQESAGESQEDGTEDGGEDGDGGGDGGEDEEDDGDGLIVDEHDIGPGSVAHQEH